MQKAIVAIAYIFLCSCSGNTLITAQPDIAEPRAGFIAEQSLIDKFGEAFTKELEGAHRFNNRIVGLTAVKAGNNVRVYGSYILRNGERREKFLMTLPFSEDITEETYELYARELASHVKLFLAHMQKLQEDGLLLKPEQFIASLSESEAIALGRLMQAGGQLAGEYRGKLAQCRQKVINVGGRPGCFDSQDTKKHMLVFNVLIRENDGSNQEHTIDRIAFSKLEKMSDDAMKELMRNVYEEALVYCSMLEALR